MKQNGLKLTTIKSSSEIISAINNIEERSAAHFGSKATVAAYLDYKVLIGTFQDSKFHFYNAETFEDKYVQRIRIFDSTKELHIWRTTEGFKGRLRIDNDGNETDVVDAYQVLFGTKAEPPDGGFTRLTEDRGVELIVPLSGIVVDDNKNRLFLHTRNYIGYNDLHQAGYVDCRFVEIIDKGGIDTWKRQ